MAFSNARILIRDYSTQDETGMVMVHYYHVDSDEQADNSYGAITATGIPAYGAVDSPSGLIVQKKKAERVWENGQPSKTWLVEVTYSPRKPSQQEPSEGGGTARSISVAISGRVIPYTTQFTADDKLVVNSANDAHPDMLERYRIHRVIQVSFETQSMTLINALEGLRQKINNDSVSLSFPQGDVTWSTTVSSRRLLCETFDYVATVSNYGFALQTAYKCELVLVEWLPPGDWDRTLIDRGYRWKKDGKFTPFQETAEYLDGAGNRLIPDPTSPSDPLPTVQEVGPYVVYEDTAFSSALAMIA